MSIRFGAVDKFVFNVIMILLRYKETFAYEIEK